MVTCKNWFHGHFVCRNKTFKRFSWESWFVANINEAVTIIKLRKNSQLMYWDTKRNRRWNGDMRIKCIGALETRGDIEVRRYLKRLKLIFKSSKEQNGKWRKKVLVSIASQVWSTMCLALNWDKRNFPTTILTDCQSNLTEGL